MKNTENVDGGSLERMVRPHKGVMNIPGWGGDIPYEVTAVESVPQIGQGEPQADPSQIESAEIARNASGQDWLEFLRKDKPQEVLRDSAALVAFLSHASKTQNPP